MKGKKIVLAITGSIAAYKMPGFVRMLKKEGAEVKVIMTEAATKFVSPLVLSVLSGNEILINVNEGSTWNNHVELALWANLILIAPCSANTLGKLANGLCDNLVTAVYLSARCPIFIAPAMDEDMWKHPSTSRNVNLLEDYGNHIIPVGSGELASGLVGPGRMAEPEEILTFIKQFSHLW
jgi:phosphopantothenoylcysteine decarboxylase/phosphopantothenate--cysteine ligase